MMNSIKRLMMVLLILGAPFFIACNGDDNEDEYTDPETEVMDDASDMTIEEGEADKILIEVAVFENVDPNAKAGINKLIPSYLDLKDALVATDANMAQQKAMGLKQATQSLAVEATKYPEAQMKFLIGELHGIQTKTTEMATGADIEAQRRAFYAVSENMYKILKAFDAANQDLFVQFCPMAFEEGAWWISDNKEIRNPYYGDKMLKCGRVEEKIAAK